MIREYLKHNGIEIYVDNLSIWQSVQIGFLNDGIEDETEFDVKRVLTEKGKSELNELFQNFCEENHIMTPDILYVSVVNSANSYDALV